MARWLKAEISFVTRTHAPEFMGADTASGEALKQREIGLIGTEIEDAWGMAARLERVYGGSGAPDLEVPDCLLEPPAVRNNVEAADNGVKVSDRESLRLIAPVCGCNNEKIGSILAEKTEDDERRMAAASAFLPQCGAVEPETNASGTRPSPDAQRPESDES